MIKKELNKHFSLITPSLYRFSSGIIARSDTCLMMLDDMYSVTLIRNIEKIRSQLEVLDSEQGFRKYLLHLMMREFYQLCIRDEQTLMQKASDSLEYEIFWSLNIIQRSYLTLSYNFNYSDELIAEILQIKSFMLYQIKYQVRDILLSSFIDKAIHLENESPILSELGFTFAHVTAYLRGKLEAVALQRFESALSENLLLFKIVEDKKNQDQILRARIPNVKVSNKVQERMKEDFYNNVQSYIDEEKDGIIKKVTKFLNTPVLEF